MCRATCDFGRLTLVCCTASLGATASFVAMPTRPLREPQARLECAVMLRRLHLPAAACCQTNAGAKVKGEWSRLDYMAREDYGRWGACAALRWAALRCAGIITCQPLGPTCSASLRIGHNLARLELCPLPQCAGDSSFSSPPLPLEPAPPCAPVLCVLRPAGTPSASCMPCCCQALTHSTTATALGTSPLQQHATPTKG